MKIYESGRESKLLDDIRKGLKTVECRLDRDKFADYQPGDQVWLREDIYKDGKIVKSIPKQVLVEVTKIEKFPTIRELMESVDFKNVVPRAGDIDEAVAQAKQFYSDEDEAKFGTLAIYFRILDVE